MVNNKRIFKIIGIIILIIVFLLLLCKCGPGSSEPEVTPRNLEQELLAEMKEDEAELLALYERSDICSEEWIEEYLRLAVKFQNYNYQGNASDIIEFLREYELYGEELEKIAELLSRDNFEESIIKLSELEDYAEEMEEGLSSLYEKYH